MKRKPDRAQFWIDRPDVELALARRKNNSNGESMQKKSWFSIAKAKAQRDAYGGGALLYLAELVAHDEICCESDIQLCGEHAELSCSFNSELASMKNSVEILEYQESLPE